MTLKVQVQVYCGTGRAFTLIDQAYKNSTKNTKKTQQLSNNKVDKDSIYRTGRKEKTHPRRVRYSHIHTVTIASISWRSGQKSESVSKACPLCTEGNEGHH